MKALKLATALASVLAIGSLASAQFSAIGPFAGNAGTESFETQTSSSGAGNINGRIFSNQGDLGSGAMLVSGGWGFGCTLTPHTGVRFTGSAAGIATYVFDQCASRFGGFFGNNTPSAVDGVASFYDAAGNLITTEVITNPNTCTWTWNGWDFNGMLVQKIEISMNNFGAFTMMDDMEADLGTCSNIVGLPMCFGDGTGTACPCGNFGAAGQGCANSATNGAALAGSGTPSVSGGTLGLSVTNCVPNVNGVFFGGTNQANGGLGNAFGDGLLCASGAIVRLEVRATDSNGDVSSSVNIAATDLSMAGDTRYYQYWFRDPNGSPCGGNFNTSGALKIVWGI